MRVAVVACDLMPDPTVLLLNLGMPLGAMAVSGALRSAGYETEIFAQSLYAEESWRKDLVSQVMAYLPDVVAISSFTHSWTLCVKLAEAIEQQLGVPLIFGGYHVSGVFRHAANGEFPDLWQDFTEHPNWLAVVGEGYATIVELIRALSAGIDPSTVQSVAMVRDGKPIISPSRARLSPSRWASLDRSRFPGIATDGAGPSSIQYTVSGVGCRFRCNHCATPSIFPGRVVRSPNSIVAEWKNILEPTGSAIWDVFEDFTGDLDWVEGVCNEINAQGMSEHLHWSSFGNVRDFTVDPEKGMRMLDRMRSCGYTRRMIIGIESADADTLKRLGRPNAFDDVVKFMGMATEAGIKVWGTVMVGYPWEEEPALRRSLDTILELPLSCLSLITIMPLPGTGFYRQCRLSGLLDEKKCFSDYTGGIPLIRSPVSDLAKVRAEYLHRFYSARMTSHPSEFGQFTRATFQALTARMEDEDEA